MDDFSTNLEKDNLCPSFQIEIQQKDGDCPTPGAMAGEVVSYLEEKGYLRDH